MTTPATRGTQAVCVYPVNGLTYGARYWIVGRGFCAFGPLLYVMDEDGKVPDGGQFGYWPFRFELVR